MYKGDIMVLGCGHKFHESLDKDSAKLKAKFKKIIRALFKVLGSAEPHLNLRGEGEHASTKYIRWDVCAEYTLTKQETVLFIDHVEIPAKNPFGYTHEQHC